MSPAARWSGIASAALGAMGLGAVFCLMFPALLTTPELRAVYPMPVIRGLIEAAILLAFALGLASVVMGGKRRIAVGGLTLSIVSLLLGGWGIPVDSPVAASNHLGLDWFLLDLLMMSVLFVPIERLFPRVPLPIVRDEFATDLVYFFVGHVLIQVFVFLTIEPATLFFRWARHPGLQAAIASQPLLLQFVEIVFVSDLFFYWTHRLLHRVPFLWRVHSVHHSPKQLDWLAGSRLHVVEIVLVRAVMFLPLFVCGFADAAVRTYVVFVALHAVLIHANVRFRFGWLEYVVATPRYHVFHHSSDKASLDTNFAVHLPFLDRVFGTQYFPADVWPQTMGVEGNPVPRGWLAQFLYPFRAA